MSRLMIACALVALFAAPLDAAPPTSQPFTMNGWQFHDYNMPRLEEAVKKAPDYGVNFFIFSHEFFRSVEGFLASTDDADPKHPSAHVKELLTPEYFRIIPHWQSDLKKIGDMATAEHIPYYLWVHEFDDIPLRYLKGRQVQMDDPGLMPYLTERYEKLLDTVPGCAGFVLTLHESDFKVFRNADVNSKEDVPGRIVKVSMLLHDILKKHNKTLILRNFFYEPLEMEYFKQAIAKLPDDIIIMSKDTTHEFHPFYPWDPLHGEVGGKKQIMEIDLGVEKAWSTHGAYSQADYLKRAVTRAREKGLVGAVGRARLHWEHSFDDTHEVNLFSFSRFMQNPDAKVDDVLHDWAVKKYPDAKEAAPYLVDALNDAEFIQHHGRWHLEYWFTKSIGTEWADYPYYFDRVVVRSRYKWSHDPADQALEEKLYHPDAETYKKLVAEKDEVVAKTRAGLADIRQTARYLSPEQVEQWEEDFRWLLDAAQLQREWVRAYFSMRLYMDNPKAEFKQEMENALDAMERIEKTPGVTYGLNPATGRRYNIDGFELEMRWRVANRARALLEDARLIDAAKKFADVASR